jgi:hypothetical protein
VNTNPSASDDAVVQAAAYLNKNQPQNDATGSTSCQYTKNCVTAAQLVDGRKPNGEVYYGHFTGSTFVPNKNEITVFAPQARVGFGLAQAMPGVASGMGVQAHATVAIKSAKVPVIPFYAYTGCDYGPQTISEPNNGHAAASVLLSHDSEPSPANQNTADLTLLTPTTVTPGDTTSNLVITGTNMTGVTKVGFFESGNNTAGPEPVTVDVSGTAVTATSVTVAAPLPSQVTSVQNVWYVRVMKNGQWSQVLKNNGTLNALTFTVGNALLTCGMGSNDGNFGTIKLQPGGKWQDTALNIAGGSPVQLAPFPNPGTGQGANWLCSATSPNDPFRTVLYPNNNLNCVDTETGMAQNAATAGFVTGLNSGGYNFSGLLTRDLTRTDAGCGATGVPATKTVLDTSTMINNDTLACFFTSTSNNIGQITSSTYSLTGPVLNKNIWHSPRLVFVPVLGVEPSNGGSNKYQIVSFRPGFVTDQTETATKTTATSLTNGITPSSNNKEVQSVQIVFFNDMALPDPPGDIPLRDYIPGSNSKKIVRLID